MVQINNIRMSSRDGLVATSAAGEFLSNDDAPVQVIVTDAQFEDDQQAFDKSVIYTIAANGMPTQRNMVYDHRTNAADGTLDVFFENRRE